MISVTEAEKRILNHLLPVKHTDLDISDISTEILAEPLIADRCYPPFHRVAMDGIGICFDSWEKGVRDYPVEDCQRAGEPEKALKDKAACLEVMTGSVLPQGCDAVIRYEDLDIKDGVAHVLADLSVQNMQNIHQKGSDYDEGEQLVSPGEALLAPHWAVSTSVGNKSVKVSKRPKVALVSTGDELVELGQNPLPHQIRKSNVYALLSSLKHNGFNDVETFHIPDEPGKIHKVLEDILTRVDVMILSGGVSKGKFDFVPQILSDLKVKEVFYKVKQRPGKPLWFGVTDREQMVFGLPGNPNSALTCFYRYVLPALWSSMELNEGKQKKYAVLKSEVNFKKALTYFLPVKIEYGEDGRIYANPIKNNGSGDFASLTRSDGFLELNEEKNVFSEGTSYPLYLWKD